ncbi:hypothetical protein J1N35_008335 [Gossypium stocksii]|uniref:Uncharacterized protein n=1 Tax=Gossypium stocksii TaxID=47602 RepID=A0A9D4AE99_9ROSI|nr:hypothetical protein J1N35_008335 [Gossypium stocksii]
MENFLYSDSQLEMVHPDDNFPTDFFSRQLENYGARNLPSDMDLFASWFADWLKNLGNLAYAGASNSLDVNVPIGHGNTSSEGLSFPVD